MNSERKEIRKFLKKSLKSDFEKILYEAKMTADEEEIIRCICCKGMSKVQTAMELHIALVGGYICGKNCGTVTTIPAAATNTVIE